MQLLINTGLVDNHLVQAFYWMFIHSLWQGMVFSVITGLVLQLTTRSTAVVRYNIISALLFAFIAVCLFTFCFEVNHQENLVNVLQPDAADNIGYYPLMHFIPDVIDYLSVNSALIVLLWFVVFFVKSARLI